MSSVETPKTYGIFATALNKKLISDLKERGEDVLIFPSLSAAGINLTLKGRELIENLTNFDWLIFTDVFAVEYFIETLREFDIDFFELDGLTICTLGETVADRLRFVQVHSDMIPQKINDEAVFSEISQFVGGEFEDLRFLVVKEKNTIFTLAENLIKKRARVNFLEIYAAFFEDEKTCVRLKTLLKGGAVDEFVFSSAEDLLALKFLLPGENLNEILSGVKTSAVGETAFLTLQENGLRPLYFHHK